MEICLWIKASIFCPAKRQVLEVKGYESAKVRASVDQSVRGGSPMPLGKDQHLSVLLI